MLHLCSHLQLDHTEDTFKFSTVTIYIADNQGYTDNYDMELNSIGAVISPEVDKNGDNIVDRDEVQYWSLFN